MTREADGARALWAAVMEHVGIVRGHQHATPEICGEVILAALQASGWHLTPDLREAAQIGFHADHEDATDILAEMFGLKRVKRRAGEWVAEFFGGTEMPFADLTSNYTICRLPQPAVPAEPEGLDAAWKAAEAALPAGWGRLCVYRFNDEWTVNVERQRAFGRGGAARYDRWNGDGDSFAAALHSLAARLAP